MYKAIHAPKLLCVVRAIFKNSLLMWLHLAKMFGRSIMKTNRSVRSCHARPWAGWL